MRGYQRRVVFLKDTGSTLFDEAYFVMRSDEMAEGKTDDDMISEADRIISENFGSRKSEFRRRLTSFLISFLLGATLMLIFTLILFE